MLTYLVSFAAGILAALSPCVLPVIPMIVGSSASQSKKGPVFLAVGMILSLIVMGLVFSTITSFLGLDESQIRLGSAVMLLSFGLIILIPGLKDRLVSILTPLSSNSIKASKHFDKDGNFGHFVIGFLLGVAWSPCVGPTLGIAMTMASSESQKLQAGLMMLIFGLGLSFPLLSIAYGLKSFFQRKRNLLFQINKFGTQILGFSTSLIGLIILTGMDKKLESFLISAIPNWYLQFSTYL